MKTPNNLLISFVSLLLLSTVWAISAHTHKDFLQCLRNRDHDITKVTYTPSNNSYESIYVFSVQNLRFVSPATLKPQVIVTPVDESQIQAVIYCCNEHGLQIRIRSGGHDFEGLSYVSEVPFVILDLFNLRSIDVDVNSATAWVQAGATLGELYYTIASKSRILGFPGGYWATVGSGGLISGGGYGPMLRKYGIASDNVIDARIIGVNGRILDRESMGEDLFWAIRGGGGGSFGVILAWKVKLVAVPETVTVFQVRKSLDHNATGLVHKWQYVAPNLNEDLCITLRIRKVDSSQPKETMQFSFIGVFHGGADRLLPIMQESFPELGVKKEDCIEMSWIQSVLRSGGFPSGTLPEILLSRIPLAKFYFKAKADYVQHPIPQDGLEGIWKRFDDIEPSEADMVWTPYGGKMSEISESQIPYPHRAGNLYMIYQGVYWAAGKTGPVSPRHLKWIRSLYEYMTPYVSKNPRGAYVNYRDFDLGVNNIDSTSYEEASIWGTKYFKDNFKRLVQVKTRVDPCNFFRHEQSIPPLPLHSEILSGIQVTRIPER